MTAPDPTLHDVWRLLGSMNRRINERLDAIERRLVAGETRTSDLEAGLGAKISALKESIEARDFRLDEHGRRLTKLEESLP